MVDVVTDEAPLPLPLGVIADEPRGASGPGAHDSPGGSSIEALETMVLRIPTAAPEADGTLEWRATTMLIVEAVTRSGERGIGYSYTSAAAGGVVDDQLADIVVGRRPSETLQVWDAMARAVRNVGLPGIAASAISAVDTALWDLRARLAGEPLCRFIGAHRTKVPIYGSGGFTSFSERELTEQLAGWLAQGIPRVKMKIGMEDGARPDADVVRVRAARKAIGPEAELFVDANGAYTRRMAIEQAHRFAEYRVSYFEEPVPQRRLDDLKAIRAAAPMAIAAGEYSYTREDTRDLLASDAVDVVQADATRCLGVTGWMEAASMAAGHATQLSAHTAPSLHAHLGCAAPAIAHVEWFADHVRVEPMVFDGVLAPVDGYLRPDPAAPGLGLAIRRPDVDRWRI
jgi:L-alanine-DL-glutamate epimerase-like enolase superfamily enzyme